MLERAVEAALEAGYRHFDTARAYENEKALGRALARWTGGDSAKREELFVVTKLPPGGTVLPDPSFFSAEFLFYAIATLSWPTSQRQSFVHYVLYQSLPPRHLTNKATDSCSVIKQTTVHLEHTMQNGHERIEVDGRGSTPAAPGVCPRRCLFTVISRTTIGF
ncbi:hypothetical protein EVAR_28404_1 [Eumeta japonica]|uniref:NADP-dependent oxidoreductase domain-containing protein n=1 Tax=Eumeta variegata TaxID=151549 RepID=A0A4C1XG60_EUMVA|nr:hypothetical protein EVAR_28404_1 [Eumeta japonica]